MTKKKKRKTVKPITRLTKLMRKPFEDLLNDGEQRIIYVKIGTRIFRIECIEVGPR